MFVGIKCCYKGTHWHSAKSIGCKMNFLVKIFSDSLPGSNERSISVTGGKAAILSVVTYVLTELGEVMVQSNQSCILFITTHPHRKMRTGGQLISMTHPPYHLTLMQIFHPLQQLVEELPGTFHLIFHLVQEVDHGVVGVEEDVVVEGVEMLESKVEIVSSMAKKRVLHLYMTLKDILGVGVVDSHP